MTIPARSTSIFAKTFPSTALGAAKAPLMIIVTTLLMIRSKEPPTSLMKGYRPGRSTISASQYVICLCWVPGAYPDVPAFCIWLSVQGDQARTGVLAVVAGMTRATQPLRR